MKNLNVSVPSACPENWSNFSATSKGAFCQSCNKEVIDFTKMNDAEILDYFSQNSSSTCGRFQSGQLKIYSTRSPFSIRPGFNLLAAGLLMLAMGTSSQSASAHSLLVHQKLSAVEPGGKQLQLIEFNHVDHIVKGVIKSEDGELLPAVNIYIKDGDEGTVSNEKGEFEFPRKLKAGEVLIFSFIGYEKVEYVVPGESKGAIEIVMLFDAGIIMGKVAVDEVYVGEPHGIRKVWSKIKSVF